MEINLDWIELKTTPIYPAIYEIILKALVGAEERGATPKQSGLNLEESIRRKHNILDFEISSCDIISQMPFMKCIVYFPEKYKNMVTQSSIFSKWINKMSGVILDTLGMYIP